MFVNRLWKLFFGAGLSKSLDDFGGQGEPPTHPELLDWLAVEFVESGWDVKHMVKLIVTSRTYRQSSRRDAGAARTRPRATGCSPGRRGSGSTPSSSATTPWPSAGCSSRDVGGPSVKPYQPAGYCGT